jgi:hypothetical protein
MHLASQNLTEIAIALLPKSRHRKYKRSRAALHRIEAAKTLPLWNESNALNCFIQQATPTHPPRILCSLRTRDFDFPILQAGETLLGERGLCVIERRARNAESERRLHNRATFDAMPTQHLVAVCKRSRASKKGLF